MRLLVDPEAFRHGLCGVTRYYAAVCRCLRERDVEVTLPILASGTAYEPRAMSFDPRRANGLTGKVAWWLGRAARWRYHRLLSSQRFDVTLLTSSHHDTSFLAYARSTPFVMIVHDTMRSLPIPGGAIDSWSDPVFKLLYLARRAASVVCVSESTRSDLMSHGGIDPARVSVVPNGNLLALWTKRSTPVAGLPERFLLFVGSRQTRKNFDGMLRALAPLLREDPSLAVVCTGALNAWEHDRIEVLGIAGQVVGVEVSDSQLLWLYEQARALVFPSLYEGFGLPVLEAMAAGCPVVASNASSLPEVAGEAALLVDPANPQALLSAVTRVLRENTLREALVEKGRSRAREFSVEAMIGSLHSVLVAAARAGKP